MGRELIPHIKTIILFNLSSSVQETQRAAAGAARLAEVGVSDIHPFKKRFVKKGKKNPRDEIMDWALICELKARADPSCSPRSLVYHGRSCCAALPICLQPCQAAG